MGFAYDRNGAAATRYPPGKVSLIPVGQDAPGSPDQMPISNTGRFTYAKQYSSWDMIQAQRQFHREQSQKYLNSASDAVSALQSAFSNQISGMATLAGQAAVNRINAAMKQLQTSAKSLDIST
jgi:hypothetical protein